MPDTQLKELWGFDDSDLSANRQGQLTAKQKTKLDTELKSFRAVYLGIGIFVAVVFCCIPIVTLLGKGFLSTVIGDLFSPSQSPSVSITEMLPIMFAFAGVALPFIFFILLIVGVVLFIYYRRGNRKTDIIVKKAQGAVNFVWVEKRVRTPGSSVRSYKDIKVLEMRVGTENNFTSINEKLTNIINEGDEWIIYYTSHPFKFLSAEFISKGK